MKKIYEDNSLTIGNTPLVRLNNIGNKHIFAKIESRNPSFSVKCRIGANMIWNAEKNKLINKNTQLIEATSGNTGIALAFVAAARNYKLTLTMPDTMSYERQKLLTLLGATLVLTEGSKGMKGAIEKAKEIITKSNTHYLMMQQFDNPANPEIHEQTTGPEIWNDINENIDVFVAGVGTGGTITGAGKFLKKQKKDITIVAVEPYDSPVISQTLLNKKIKIKPHKIQGIGAGFIPNILDLNLIDKVETITNDEAINMTKHLIIQEGILSGISSGAAVAAAIKLQQNKEYVNKNIVVILPSATERYLSTTLFDSIK